MKLEVEKIAEMIPLVRAEIARELSTSYNLSQGEISRLLRVSQPAVSQYLRNLRGRGKNAADVRNDVKAICGRIINGGIKSEDLETEVYSLCKAITKK